VVRAKPFEPEPRPGGRPALHTPASLGSYHRQHPVVLGICGANGARIADPRHFPQALARDLRSAVAHSEGGDEGRLRHSPCRIDACLGWPAAVFEEA
jgi:hypothetical protein